MLGLKAELVLQLLQRRGGAESLHTDDAAIGADGLVIGMKTFGASAPLKELQHKFGFEPEHIVDAALELLGRK